MHTKRKFGIGMTAAVAALGIAVAFVFQPAFSQAQMENAVVADEHPMSPPAPPEPFSIKVNGSSDPGTITVKRGEIAQIDVLVTPLIPGIEGNVSLESYRPECGLSGLQTGCVVGITALLSQNSVTSAENLVVTITVAPDTKPGTYTYQIVADTMMDLPDQDTPAKVGNIHSFSINVV